MKLPHQLLLVPALIVLSCSAAKQQGARSNNQGDKNSNQLADIDQINTSNLDQLKQGPSKMPSSALEGKTLYQNYCMICHGEDLKGSGMYVVPNLNTVLDRLGKNEIVQTVMNGRGQMPPFGDLEADKIDAILAYFAYTKEKS